MSLKLSKMGGMCCEQFYKDQTPWLVAGMSQLLGLLGDPSSMGRLGSLIIWKVKDVGGPSPFKSMKDGGIAQTLVG